MTTHTANTVIAQTDDTTFRAWVNEFYNGMIAIGATLTADTGQINLATVTRPVGSHTVAGYHIFLLPGTPNMYFKAEYGTGGAVTTPSMWGTFGTATNGSGSISGAQTARIQFNSLAPASTTTAYPTNMCRVAGLVTNVEFKAGYTANGPIVFFSLSRTVDDTGTATSNGCWLMYRSGSSANISYGYLDFTLSTFTVYPVHTFCFIPGNLTSSIDGTTPQIFRHYGPTPRIRPIIGTCTMLSSEISEGGTFTTKPVGSVTARTYRVVRCCRVLITTLPAQESV